MATITITVKESGLNPMAQWAAALTGKLDKITAIAMSNGVKQAKAQLQSSILPQIQGGPTAWTSRGLRYWSADRNRLVAAVGWNHGDGSPVESSFTPKGLGVPSGRYMSLLARGGDRRPKSTELALRRAGVIRPDQFITPASSGARLNRYGNLPGPTYQSILSRVGAASATGYNANASGSNRSRRRRAQSDYFTMYGDLGEGARFIARRVGKRGFVPALFVVDQPNYERKFDIHGIAMREYQRVFPAAFQKALDNEIARRSR